MSALHEEARKKRRSARLALQPANLNGGRLFHRDARLAGRGNSEYPGSGAARTRTAGKAAGPESGPCATIRVQIPFSWTPMSARPFAAGGRLAVPSVYIAAEPGRVGQALPLLAAW